MKYVCFLSISLASMLLQRVVFASEEIIVKVIVPEAEFLSVSDVAAIEQAKDGILLRRDRNLRSSNNRRLDPAWCLAACRGFSFPMCQIWRKECHTTYHRQLSSSSIQERKFESSEELVEVTGTTCTSKTQEVLTQMKKAVGKSSESIVDGSHLTCFEVRPICRVTGFSLWNADNEEQSLERLSDGSLVDSTKFNFNIEAVAEDCVGIVDFLLEGPDGLTLSRAEKSQPYMMFGNQNSNILDHTIVSSLAEHPTLPLGPYTLKVLPDANMNIMKTVQFELI